MSLQCADLLFILFIKKKLALFYSDIINKFAL